MCRVCIFFPSNLMRSVNGRTFLPTIGNCGGLSVTGGSSWGQCINE